MRVGKVLAAWRAEGRMGVREAAKIIGVSSATLNRIERGHDADGKTVAKLFNWLFGPSP